MRRKNIGQLYRPNIKKSWVVGAVFHGKPCFYLCYACTVGGACGVCSNGSFSNAYKIRMSAYRTLCCVISCVQGGDNKIVT